MVFYLLKLILKKTRRRGRRREKKKFQVTWNYLMEKIDQVHKKLAMVENHLAKIETI